MKHCKHATDKVRKKCWHSLLTTITNNITFESSLTELDRDWGSVTIGISAYELVPATISVSIDSIQFESTILAIVSNIADACSIALP